MSYGSVISFVQITCADIVQSISQIGNPEAVHASLSDEICKVLQTGGFGRHEPTYRLLPLLHRGVMLRVTALKLYRSPSELMDASLISSLLASGQILEEDLLTWTRKLPPNWPSHNHLYEVLSVNLFRVHRILLQDLFIRCRQRIDQLQGTDSEHEIQENVQNAQELVDEICSTVPYDFEHDNLGSRKPEIRPAVIPNPETKIMYHITFS